MTDITSEAEHVSSTNAANDCHYLSTDGICKKSVSLALQPLTREQADNLDLHHGVSVDFGKF